MTIDVEEYFHSHNIKHLIPRSTWDERSGQAAASCTHLLTVLEEMNATATFFVLGWIADRFPELVREIAKHGHEIGTHGYCHELVYEQTPEAFANDLADSLRAIRNALGDPKFPIRAYRAPVFSITDRSLWALDVLQAHGIQYDSSISPVSHHDRYGKADAPTRFTRLSDSLIEIPPPTVRLFHRNVPIGGGGYFRLYPYWLTRAWIRTQNLVGEAAVVYVHPWELMGPIVEVPGVPASLKLRQEIGVPAIGKFRRLLGDFRFGSIHGVLQSWYGETDKLELSAASK